MGFWLTVDSNKTLPRKSRVLAAEAALGEFLFAEEQNSFSSVSGSLLAYNFALLHAKEENTAGVVDGTWYGTGLCMPNTGLS